ncbi:MAG: hypothetical protein JSV97_05000 [candidate division WOR-3 bacterium]|nr:MAG: hypothetical protein JSV97_05000 [candidate division WOR-3 bacterium]
MKSPNGVRKLIAEHGTLYSEQLGIRLKTKTEQELFKWFLASVLFGKRIGENIAMKTYREFERARILTPKKILEAGWDRLVELLDTGGYVRYDFSTATRLLQLSKELLERFGERPLTAIHEIVRDNNELELALQSLKGIGPVTTNIFLRELRPVWKKADPDPMPVVKKIAQKLGIDLESMNRKTEKFTRLEAALVRMRKKFKS